MRKPSLLDIMLEEIEKEFDTNPDEVVVQDLVMGEGIESDIESFKNTDIFHTIISTMEGDERNQKDPKKAAGMLAGFIAKSFKDVDGKNYWTQLATLMYPIFSNEYDKANRQAMGQRR